MPLKNCVFLRNSKDDESMVWCPRTGGCSVMKDAQPILEEITDEWRDEQEVVVAVAQKFECRRGSLRIRHLRSLVR